MRQFSNVACTVCGCVCDDLTVTVDGDYITRAEHACVLAEPWFLRQNRQRPAAALVDGQPVALEDAFKAAAAILSRSRFPLIYGLSRSTSEGQRAAVALAERIGATIDTTASTGHAPSLMALQQVGESTCTLGEVKNRADLVIYWGADPVQTHPRHMERYLGVAPDGAASGNPGDRFVVVIAAERNSSADRADHFLRIEPGKDWEALWTLRALVASIEPSATVSPGVSLSELRALATRMKASRCGIVFFGVALTQGHLGHRQVEALLQLVTDLNTHTRFYARRLRRLGDVAGADSVLTWQSGYPFSVNFATGYPRYNPGEFSAPDMLARGEPDACLFVGSETSVDFPTAALEHLHRVPLITIDSPNIQVPTPAAVRFTTSVYGIHQPGTAYRMDEVPIPLRVLLPSDYPSDKNVLERILEMINRE